MYYLTIMYRRFFCFCITTGLLTVFFAACRPAAPAEPLPQKVFRLNLSSAVYSLDPAFAKDLNTMNIALQVFNGLVQLDEYAQVQPCVAKSWDISEDGRTYTFHLRRDVRFHDCPAFGSDEERVLTAHDVVFSFKRLISPELAAPGAWVFNGKTDSIAPFTALNDSIFQLRLLQPFRPILGILTMQYCSIVSEKAVQYFGKDFRHHPIGSGAFAFRAWKENEALILLKNKDYWEKDKAGIPLPHIDAVRFSFTESKKTAYLRFIEGDLDYLSGIDASYKDELLTPEGNLQERWKEKILLRRVPYFNTEYLGIKMDSSSHSSPLQIRAVRQALNYAIDRREMLRVLRNQVGRAAEQGFLPHATAAYDSTLSGYTYQPERAKKLVRDAAISGKVPPITLETTSSYADLCVYMQKQWANVGITTHIELLPPAHLREKMAKGESSFFRASWIGDYPDEETFMSVFYSKNPAPPNYTHFQNAAFDALYEQALQAGNDTIRRRLYHQMDSLIVYEAPVVPLFYDEVLRFLSKKIKRLPDNGFNLLNMKYIELEEKQ